MTDEQRQLIRQARDKAIALLESVQKDQRDLEPKRSPLPQVVDAAQEILQNLNRSLQSE